MTVRRLLRLPWFPFLIASYPIWHLYSVNVFSVPFSEVLRPLILVEMGTLALFASLSLVLKDAVRSSLITTCGVVGLFSYDHVRTFLREWANYLWATDWFLAHRFFLIAWVIAWVVLADVLRRQGKSWNPLILPVNAAALVLVALPLIALTHSLWFTPVPPLAPTRTVKLQGVQPTAAADPLPDIYYIILDGYGRADMLQMRYGFDNSVFLNFLRQQGFYVADASQANFNRTFMSLATSLNMAYPHPPAYYLLEGHRKGRVGRGQDPEYLAVINQTIADNAVLRYVRQRGYTTIQVASGLGPTDDNPFVDIAVQTSVFNRFETQLIGSSLLSVTYPWLWRQRILNQFAALADLPRLPGPKFVFAHIISPHPPFLFDRDGKLPPLQDLGTMAIGDPDIWGSPRYIDQLVYINRQAQATVEAILARSTQRPIIILQGDHGPGCYTWPSLVGPSRALTTAEATTPCIRARMAILNAYYLPGDTQQHLYADITPINTFRLVFKQCLDGDFPLEEDKSFVFSCGETCEYFAYKIPRSAPE